MPPLTHVALPQLNTHALSHRFITKTGTDDIHAAAYTRCFAPTETKLFRPPASMEK
jgi:hypothetical protein